MGKRILLAGRNAQNLKLLGEVLEEEGYNPLSASSTEGLDAVLDEGTEPDLVLIDVEGFGTSIWERCERLKQSNVPFFVIFPREKEKLQKEGARHGASGVLNKPLVREELLGLVSGLLES